MAISERKEEERSIRKEKILTGALEVFKVTGIEKSTMEQIALKSGFGTATIYYYFHSKDEIFSAILLDGWEKLCNFLEKPIPSVDFPHANKRSYSKLSRIINKIKSTTKRKIKHFLKN